MKKIFLLIAPLLLASCSDDDSTATDTTANTASAFNPPSWIQGAWAPESSTEEYPHTFLFSGDNICHAAANTNSICWKESIEGLAKPDYFLQEQVSDSTYTVIYNLGGRVTSFMFTKLANNKIDVFVPAGAEFEETAGVFVKQ
ncbi:MAG: hypothetical protein DI539_00205 [Flavobacterium psychrophilum]|nr:MAG: hypothetical protein DI539_00205 [Flavobacterium psychrophilum]